MELVKENLVKKREELNKELEKIEEEINTIYIKYNLEQGVFVEGEIGEKLKKLKTEFTRNISKIKTINKLIYREGLKNGK